MRGVAQFAWATMLVAGLLSPVVTAEPPVLKIPRLDRAPTLEDFLEMKPDPKMEGRMLRVDGFLQRDPSDGKPISQRTEAYLGYDDKNFYTVFVCFDAEPGAIRARLGRREAIFDDDTVGLFLDTFHDRQRSYEFIVNPLGIQADGIVAASQDDDFSFDTLWSSEGRLTEKGYVVWIAIPFKSLRFSNNGKQVWGLALGRFIPRSNEQSFWPYITRKVAGFVQQLATLEGLEDIHSGRNLQFIPYSIFSRGRFLDQRSTPVFRKETEGRAGLDAKVVLRDALTLDVALNPDFSQVESDEPQVTVNQRFEVFFPEKRPFFIENGSYFQTPINLFFSRRIADPQFGGRLTGKLGHWALGALAIDDRAPGKRLADGDPLRGERAHFAVMRVSREFPNQSHVGAIYTDREFNGSFNRVGGVDALWKMNKNWVGNFQAVASSSRLDDGAYQAGPAYLAEVYRAGRKLWLYGGFSDYSPGFHTETGFVPRTDYRRMGYEYNYRFRPEGKHLISWGPHSYFETLWDHQGTRLEYNSYNDIAWNFKRDTWFGVLWNIFREQLRPKDFSVLGQNRDYSHHNPGFFFGSSFFRQVSVNGLIRFGDRVNFLPPNGREPFLAHTSVGNFGVTLRPMNRLRIDNTYIINRYLDRGPAKANIFNNHVVRSKWNWQFNRELSVRVIFQYSTVLANAALTSLQTAKNFNADFLITYFVHPGTALYIGYNSNLQNLDPRLLETDNGLARTRNRYINDGKQFFVKLSYLFRF